MADSSVKFTKRLSVRIAAACGLLAAGGAVAIAQSPWVGWRGQEAEPAAQTAPDELAVKPIPFPGDESPARGQLAPDSEQAASAENELAGPAWPASEDEQSTVSVRPASASAEMVIRANDDRPSRSATPSDPAPAFDRNALPELPEGPQFDDTSIYASGPALDAPAAPQPDSLDAPPADPLSAPASGQFASPPAADSLAAADQTPTDSLAAPPAELDSALREAARSTISDTADSLAPPPVERQPAAALVSSDSPAQPASENAPQDLRGGLQSMPSQPDASDMQATADQAAPPAMGVQDFTAARATREESEPRALTSPPAFDAPAARGSQTFAGGDTELAPGASGMEGSAGAAGFEGDGAPGGESLDGRQSPSLTIEKLAPPEIQVGKEASFQVRIRNVGQISAHDLIVLDRVPRGTRFVNASPQAAQTSDGQLMWQLGALEPGDETAVTLNVLPFEEGEIGSVAQVLFQTHASARTICTRPELTVEHTGPAKVLIGDTVALDIVVSNPGTGAATGVVLVEDVPPGLSHAAGQELEYDVGTLKPGESRRLQLTLKAAKAGVLQNGLIVRGDGNLLAKDAITMEVVAPSLQVSLNGPKMRYLEREATYEVGVTNAGTAVAREVELVTYLPKGMRFLSADHKGQYEPQNHAVYWSVEELPPQETGVAKLTVLPQETGEQKLSVEGRAELGLKDSAEKLVQVESLAELHFTVSDEADPIEVGSETTYLISLSNTGSSAATNVQLLVGLPPELKPVGGDGPTKVMIEGPRLTIDPLGHLGPGEQAQYKLSVRGVGAGQQRIQVQLVTAETPVPITKEELTRVYEDQ